MTTFTEHFWGDKHNGFDVLYHNMKHGQDSGKEFADFLRESCTVEENYAKSLAKLAKSASNWGSKGTFGPFWHVLRGLADKLSSIHLQLVHAWADLAKDVQRYGEEQIKKHKMVKDQEAGTLETVHTIQATVVTLQKAKEAYHARCFEYEKLKRDAASQKELEKAEAKFRKANDEYRAIVDRYANIRKEFETKMLESCRRFQELEEYHLHQMKDFVNTYAKAWEHQHVVLGQVHQEFAQNSNDLTVEKLMEMFVSSKTTGTEKPGPIEFIEADLSTLPPAVGTPDSDKRDFPILEKPKKEGGSGESSSQGSPDNQPRTGPVSLLDRTLPLRSSHGWFLNRRRHKDKKKKKKEKDKVDENSEDTTCKVDVDGFSIRPENPMDNQNDNNSWYSTSDSESDTEDKKKIKVSIKPYSPSECIQQNNVDVIKKSIVGLRLSPTANRRQQASNDPNMKRSISVSDSMSTATKPSQDLLNLDIFNNVASSSASTPTGGNYAFPTSTSAAGISSNSSVTTPATTPLEEHGPGHGRSDTPPVTSRIMRSQTPTGLLSSAPLLPGPPVGGTRSSLRNNMPTNAMARPAGRQSPALVVTSTQAGNLSTTLNNSSFSTSSAWSSRGPSPLTVGLSDTIPLAVAFSETINAYFRGSDEEKCRVKVTGDMMMSFPAGIVRVLVENPSPAVLTFRIKNTINLEHILVNSKLLTEDISQSTGDSKLYMFEMASLIEHLRHQAEQNRSASYFNIDILKYQVRSRPGQPNVPLTLVSYWKCEDSETDFRLDYKYIGAATRNHASLSNLTVIVPVSGQVTNMQAAPNAAWSAESNRAVWRLGDISDVSEVGDHGCIRAKFNLCHGPSLPSTVAVQFLSEGSTLSGIDFELAGTGYRVSLIKKRFITGKYISEAAGS